MNNEDIMLELALAFFIAKEMNALSTILEYWQGHKEHMPCCQRLIKICSTTFSRIGKLLRISV